MVSDLREEQSITSANTLPDYEITDSDSVIVLLQFNLGVQMLSNTHVVQLIKWTGPTVIMDTFKYWIMHPNTYTINTFVTTFWYFFSLTFNTYSIKCRDSHFTTYTIHVGCLTFLEVQIMQKHNKYTWPYYFPESVYSVILEANEIFVFKIMWYTV